MAGTGFVKYEKPEDVKVTLGLRTTFSEPTATLPALHAKEHENGNGDQDSGSKSHKDVFIRIHARIIKSEKPDSPVTLATWKTALQSKTSGSGVWIEHALTYLESTSDSSRKGGPEELGYKFHRRGGDYDRDLREEWEFLTIPSLESGEEIVIEHRLPVEDLQFGGSSGTEDDLPRKGEKWRISPSEDSLGTWWWNWGDLKTDLKDKKFKNHNWYEGEDKGEAEGEEWVPTQGDNGEGLTYEIQGSGEIEFV